MVSYHLISEIQATHYAATRNTSVETNRDRFLGRKEPIMKVYYYRFAIIVKANFNMEQE